MNDIQTIFTERVDDIPLLIEQMKRMALPTLIDTHFPAHGDWYGLSMGWISTIWLSSIVSQGDHRLSHVEPGVATRLWTLQTASEQEVERLGLTSAKAGLRARVAKAKAQVEALNLRGRGRKRFENMETLRQTVNAIAQRHGVEDFLWLRYDQHTTTRPVRAYQERPAYVKQESQATVEVRVDEEALEAVVRRLGWRIDSTNQPAAQLSLEQAVLAYRHEYQVERSFGRLKGRPLSLRPMYVQRDDHATGLLRLLSIALRVLILLEFSVRRQLAAEEASLRRGLDQALSGLYAGNPKRETARPTAERLLEAFRDVTLTVIETVGQIYCHSTALSPLQERILELLGFSSRVYRRLCTVSDKPL
jgi:transposase